MTSSIAVVLFVLSLSLSAASTFFACLCFWLCSSGPTQQPQMRLPQRTPQSGARAVGRHPLLSVPCVSLCCCCCAIVISVVCVFRRPRRCGVFVSVSCVSFPARQFVSGTMCRGKHLLFDLLGRRRRYSTAASTRSGSFWLAPLHHHHAVSSFFVVCVCAVLLCSTPPPTSSSSFSRGTLRRLATSATSSTPPLQPGTATTPFVRACCSVTRVCVAPML